MSIAHTENSSNAFGHALIWIHEHPKTRERSVAFDNAFAGKISLHKIPTDKLFSCQHIV